MNDWFKQRVWNMMIFILLLMGILSINKRLDTLIELHQPPEEEQMEELFIEDLETGLPMLMIG